MTGHFKKVKKQPHDGQGQEHAGWAGRRFGGGGGAGGFGSGAGDVFGAAAPADACSAIARPPEEAQPVAAAPPRMRAEAL